MIFLQFENLTKFAEIILVSSESGRIVNFLTKYIIFERNFVLVKIIEIDKYQNI